MASRPPPDAGRPLWQHDVEAVVCGECHAPFTALRRRHHCRGCGRLFCESCSHQRLLIPGDMMARPRKQPATALAPLNLDPRVPQRVCPPCAKELIACQEELRRTVSRASQRHFLSRRSLDRYLNAPITFDLDSAIKNAAYTLYNFTSDSLEGRDAIPRELIWGAQGLAFLTMVKAGMIFTARLGSGLVIGRLPDNYDDDSEASSNATNATSDTPREQRRRRAQRGLPRWSAPSAITCSGVGYGFQMGLELIDVVIILNTPSALEAFASATQVAVGTELSISLGPLGRTAATDLHAGRRGVLGAAFAYGQSKGLFLGVSLEGTVILSRPAVNRGFYGKHYSTHELLLGQAPPPRAAEPLYQALDEVLSGESTDACGVGTRAAGLGADHAESTWHGYLARHTRHRRHHNRRRSAEAAAEAAAAEAAAAVGGPGPGDGEVCCRHMGDGVDAGDEDELPGEEKLGTRRMEPSSGVDEAWEAERARRLQQSRAQEEQNDALAEVLVGRPDRQAADPLLQRRELRTYKQTAVFGASGRAEAAAGRVGPGPGHNDA